METPLSAHQIRQINNHDRYLQVARSVVKRAEGAYDFETAYQAFSHFDATYLSSSLIGTKHSRVTPLAELDSSSFFRLTEAADMLMHYADEEYRRHAARFVIEASAIAPMSANGPRMLATLDQLLNINRVSDKSIPFQVVEQHLLPDGTFEDQVQLTQELMYHNRVAP